MKGNVWLAVYIVLSLLVIGGAGFYCFREYSTYSENFGSWNERSRRIEFLEKEKPSPTEGNAKTFQDTVNAYEQKVNLLFEALNGFQRPLNEQLKNTQFPQTLKQKVDAFKALAEENQMTIDKVEEFFFAMDDYKEILPKQDITPLLSYQLEAIEHICKHLVTAGVSTLNSVERETLPGEVRPNATGAAGDSAPPAAATSVVQKYPMDFKFECQHKAYQDFVNLVANDRDFFLAMRILKVENSAPEGPSGADEAPVEGWIDEDLNDVPEEDVQRELGTLSPEEALTKAAELGWVAKTSDARILFGQETVNVWAVIDLVRFLRPEEVQAAPAAPPSSRDSGGSRRRRGGDS